jgi:triacylglycerol esterase/lipase EstA (alpha/beta hydrolase family)
MRLGHLFKAFAIGCVALAIALSTSPAQAASGDSNAATPVLYLHGYDPTGLGDDCTMWSNMTTFLTGKGFTGPQVTLKYYHNDSNCGANLNNYGTQSAYYSGGLVSGEDSTSTDIRHIAYQFAWYVYNTYTAKGQNVGVVAHSMGGLVARYALYRVAAKDSAFPSSLLVSNIVTFGTPHNGANAASLCTASNIECAEMTAGSAFLADLNTNGQNPQGQGGTDWTIMGSDYDSVVSDASATSMTANHKIRYASSDYIDHTSYYNKTQTTLDAALSASDNGSAFTSTTTGEWPVLRAQKALTGSAY